MVFLSNKYFTNRIFAYSMLERDLGGADGKAGLVKFSLPTEVLAAGI